MSRVRAWLDRAASFRRDVVGINRRNVGLVYAHNERHHYPLADDKLLTKEHLLGHGVPTPEVIAVCENLGSIGAVLDAVAKRGDFVVKPARASGGQGLLVVGPRTGDGQWQKPSGTTVTAQELSVHLANIVFGAFGHQLEDRAFIEQRVHGHPMFVDLWAEGLCDVRVITLRERPLMAMIRVPTKRSEGRANLHQGGIGLAVDLASGRTERAWYRRATIDTHPESGAPLLGLEVPSWEQVLDTARRTAASMPLGYLGVDIVVDTEGAALVLEVNARPGLEIQNVVGSGLGTYLDEPPVEATR